MKFQNFYLKGKVELLDLPIGLPGFEKEDGTYMNVVEYLQTQNHTIERFSSDGFFLKGFGMSVDFIDALREFLSNKGFVYKVDYFLITEASVHEELAKDIWKDGINH